MFLVDISAAYHVLVDPAARAADVFINESVWEPADVLVQAPWVANFFIGAVRLAGPQQEREHEGFGGDGAKVVLV